MLYPNEEHLYAAIAWQDCTGDFEDILYHKSTDGIAKITINRPQVRNAFRPQTVKEMIDALANARYDDGIGVIILTGAGDGPSAPAATRKCAATTAAIATTAAYITSTCWTFSARSAPARNRWWRWWPAIQSAAATCCT